MPFILAILGALAAASYYFFIIRRSVDAASQAADAVSTAYGKTRWWFWKRKNLKQPHELIDNPVHSATCLLLVIMRMEGELSDKHWSFLRGVLENTFGVEPAEIEELIAQARFSIHKVQDAPRFFQRQGTYLKGFLTEEECDDLLDALTEAATMGSKMSLLQDEAIRKIERVFGAA
ncbi:MAG: hypothetical protein ACPGVN_08435 [Alphaproteobacteria bacterium]